MTQNKQNLVDELELTGDFKVLRRFIPPYSYLPPDGSEESLKTAMVIDTETTGLDKGSDKIIEIGYVLARFLPETGQIYDITGRYNGIQDPGFPLPEKITRITGITDADVKGQSFDRGRILGDIAKANIIVAHNSTFDRGFIEREFSAAADKWWACSVKEAPWEEMLTGSSKLEYLSYKVAGVFYDAHRALADAEVLLHLLTHKAHDGDPILKHILTQSRQNTYCVWAEGAPFDKKELLKVDRGYRWSDGADPASPIKAWFKDGIKGKENLAEEMEYLAAHIYSTPVSITVDEITGRERFTNRYQLRNKVAIVPVKAAMKGPK